MAQFNENVIAFVGDESQMRNVLLTMAANYQAAAGTLEKRGIPIEDPFPEFSGLSSLAAISQAIRERCFEPLYLLDSKERSYTTSDAYEFDWPEKLTVPDVDESWYRLVLAFDSSSGLAAEALEKFTRTLPNGSYAIAGAYRFEGDADSAYLTVGNLEDGGPYDCGSDADKRGFYFDGGDDIWRSAEVKREIAAFAKEPLSPQKIAKSVVLQVAANWLGLGPVEQPNVRARAVKPPRSKRTATPVRSGQKPAPNRPGQSSDRGPMSSHNGSNADATGHTNIPDAASTLDFRPLDLLCRLPFAIDVSGSAYGGCEAVVETLLPGQVVRLVANWESPYFHPCAIEAYTTDGRRFGNLDENVGISGERAVSDRFVTLALILPHVVGVVEEALPLSVRGSRAKHSKVTVRIEIADTPLGNLLDEARELLKRPEGERGVSSAVNEEEEANA